MMVQTVDALGVIGNLAAPIQLALNYWSRRSELSADRAELVYLGDSTPVMGVLARLAGGPVEITGDINFEEYAAQADYYQELQKNGKWQKLLQSAAVMNQQHPFSAVRVQEILKWEKSEQYQRLRIALANKNDKQCPHCGRAIESQNKFCRYCGKAQ
jgi:Zn-dependent protease with chaperone function